VEAAFACSTFEEAAWFQVAFAILKLYRKLNTDASAAESRGITTMMMNALLLPG
jgi:hypothetical protein